MKCRGENKDDRGGKGGKKKQLVDSRWMGARQRNETDWQLEQIKIHSNEGANTLFTINQDYNQTRSHSSHWQYIRAVMSSQTHGVDLWAAPRGQDRWTQTEWLQASVLHGKLRWLCRPKCQMFFIIQRDCIELVLCFQRGLSQVLSV